MCHVLLQTEKGENFFSRVKKEGHSKIFNGCRITIIDCEYICNNNTATKDSQSEVSSNITR